MVLIERVKKKTRAVVGFDMASLPKVGHVENSLVRIWSTICICKYMHLDICIIKASEIGI